MKFLIVSDIHAISEDLKRQEAYHGGDASGFLIENRNASKNPILALRSCLETHEGEIRALLCLGDFAHQSKRLVMLQVWHDLHEVARSLRIPDVIGITGNHDIATRSEDIGDAEARVEFLKSISPSFPSHNQVLFDGYHKDGVGTLDLEDCLLVAFDTCRLHGLGSDALASKKIWSVGHLSEGMIEKAQNAIVASSSKHVVLMMHHHPLKIDEITDQEYDQMLNGPMFLERLSRTDKNCIVVHGHKHSVNLKRSTIGTRPAIVLSAASLAAFPYMEQSTHFSNQFHLLDFDTSIISHPEGVIYSWDWGPSRWEESKKYSMPHVKKFGPVLDIDNICDRLKSVNITSYLQREELLKAIPEMEYLSLEEVEDLNSRLDSTGRLLVQKQSLVVGLAMQGKS